MCAKPLKPEARYPLAIYHLSVQVVSRSAGRSSVAAAAYRAGERLIDERLGTVHNYQRKEGIEHTEIFAPKKTPAWVFERERLWNAVEKAEMRCDAQVAREVRIALPKELTDKRQLKLIRRFIRDNFVARGMIADLAIHRDNPENPHAHILLTMRPLTPSGFANKNRDWNRKEVLGIWRENWEHACNRALRRAGVNARVDHRSHIARGFLTLPGIKIGLQNLFSERDKRTLIAERLQKHDTIVRLNGEAIRQDPRIALQELTYHEATFTRAEVGVWLNSRTADTEQFQACLTAIMAHPEVVQVGLNARKQEVFSTAQTLESEKQMLGFALGLAEERDKASLNLPQVNKLCAQFKLSDEQAVAVKHLVNTESRLALLEGFAGTGKSYMFRAAAKVWEKQGRRVLGMALSGKAAEGLGEGAKIKDCRSIAAWEYAWKNGEAKVRKGDVLVVDEAGMVGTAQMRRLLENAHRAGAKVVLAGDTEQLQAVEAGSPFRAIGEMAGKVEMVGIRRQAEEWQRAASLQLARGQTAQALSAYTRAGSVHGAATDAEALAHLMQRWEAHERQNHDRSQLAVGYLRAHIPELNQAIRGLRQRMGKLGGDVAVLTEHGERRVAVGDRLCFTKNNRKLGVKNGTLAVIERTAGGLISVRLDGDEKKRVTFSPQEWKHFDLGYAVTVHRSQGVTVDHTHVFACKAFDRHASYVALTRHRERLDVYYSREEFAQTRGLAFMMGRERRKSLALDFVKAERDNQRLAEEAGLAARPAPPEAPALPNQAKVMVEAGRDYAAAEKLAKQKQVTLKEILHTLEETAEARQRVIQTAQQRAWWRTEIETYERHRPLSARLGFKKPPAVCPPQGGPRLDIYRGLEKAEAAVTQAAKALEDLCRTPALYKKARAFAEAHNGPIVEARKRLPELEKAYDAAKHAFENAPQHRDPGERDLGRDRDRSLGR